MELEDNDQDESDVQEEEEQEGEGIDEEEEDNGMVDNNDENEADSVGQDPQGNEFSKPLQLTGNSQFFLSQNVPESYFQFLLYFSLAEYILGESGVKECPKGYNEITDAESCEQAAPALGLTYIDHGTGPRVTCHFKPHKPNNIIFGKYGNCLLSTSPSPRDQA